MGRDSKPTFSAAASALGLTVLVVVILGIVPQAATGTAFCAFTKVLTFGGEGTCDDDDDDTDALLASQQQRAEQTPLARRFPKQEPSDTTQETSLEMLERHRRGLALYWQAAGDGRFRQPLVGVTNRPSPRLILPPNRRAAGGVPRMGIRGRGLPDYGPGSSASARASAVFDFAHLFGLLASHDFEAQYKRSDRRLVLYSDVFRECDQSVEDCSSARARRLQADCYAGAYARWAQGNGLLSGSTARLIMRNLADDVGAIDRAWRPDGSERVERFRQGYGSDQEEPDPDVC
jgi:hypothetical protein